ncbi:MAG: hypothetical protein AABX48_02465 [Nanoarchaeota archaeon]
MKKSLIIGGIVFIVILVIIGTIFYIDKPSSNESNANQDLVGRIQSGDKSGEWLTYQNDIYGFEVQYPPYGFLTRDGWRFSADYGDYYIVEIRIPSPPAFFIDVDPKRNCDTFNFQNSNMNVGGNPAIEEIKYFSDGTEYREVHFIKGEQCYAIQMMGPGFEDAEKMLTTFKFTN